MAKLEYQNEMCNYSDSEGHGGRDENNQRGDREIRSTEAIPGRIQTQGFRHGVHECIMSD